MRTLFTTLAIGLAAAWISGPQLAGRESSEAIDFLGNEMKGWSRFGEGESPWRLTSNQTLLFQGEGSESLVQEELLFDGTLSFEYRFLPTEGKSMHRASFWVRKTPEGTGCKFALGENCGQVSAVYQGSSDRLIEYENSPEKSPAKAIGEWNEVKVTLEARSATLTINAKDMPGFAECDADRGLFVLEGEGSAIEFRNIHWKPKK